MNKKLIFFLSLIISITHYSYSDIQRHAWDSQRAEEKEIIFTPMLSHFWSSKNFDSVGNTILPTELKSIQKTHFDLYAQYGFTDKITAFARLSWARINVERYELGRTLSGTRFGLGDQALGLNYKTFQFKNGSWIELQGTVDFPAYSNKDSQKDLTPYLGDQTVNMSIGPHFTLPFGLNTGKDLRLEAGAAFTWRSKNYSSHIPWKLGVFYLPKEKKGFTFSLAGLGIFSLKNDKYRTRNNIGFSAGSSNLTSAANSSFAQIRAQVGYAFSDQTRLFLEGTTTVWGQTAAKGSSFGLFAELRFGAPYSSTTTETSENTENTEGFLSYDFQASILDVNDRLNLLKIDKGTSDGVLENQEFDIFSVTSQGKIKEAIARGRVISTKDKEAVVKVIRFYKEVWIERGFIVKRPI